MSGRLDQLRTWHLPPTLLRLAHGDLPHPAFRSVCESLRVEHRRDTSGLRLDQAETRAEAGGHLSAALWEHDVGDGHAFEVVYCAKVPTGFEFWHVMYADDTDGPEAELVARSEQGLYFWLFFRLIPSEFFHRGERAYSTLAAAAEAVGFDHLIEVFRLEQEIGSDSDRRRELNQCACSIGS